MLRDKKLNDVNEGKWIGVGGKFEEGETAGECLKREVREETGISPASFLFHGIIYFRNDEYEDEEMYLYSAEITDDEARSALEGSPCSEGTLSLIPDDEIMELSLWEGDRIFLKELLSGKKRISWDLTYEKGELVRAEQVPVRNILFDLDGTLIDTGEGIMKSAQYALEDAGIEIEDYRELKYFVGPPLVYTYTHRFGFDMAEARRLVSKYRERYNDVGLFECEPYPCVVDCLKGLKEHGYRVFVASSKPEHMCRKLMAHFDMLNFFDDIAGSTPDGRIDTKSQVLMELFRRNADADPGFIGSAVLAGDTRFDVAGANDVGIPCIGVSFGYGEAEELTALGAVAIADSMAEINDGLLRSL